MKMIQIVDIHAHTKQGINKEQCLAYALCGTQPHKHDNIRFDIACDIPELKMSVKAYHASLCTGGLLHGNTIGEMMADFIARSVATQYAYVTNDYKAYIMDKVEFEQFILTFGVIERDSAKNGGKMKIRIHPETYAMYKYLSERIA